MCTRHMLIQFTLYTDYFGECEPIIHRLIMWVARWQLYTFSEIYIIYVHLSGQNDTSDGTSDERIEQGMHVTTYDLTVHLVLLHGR